VAVEGVVVLVAALVAALPVVADPALVVVEMRTSGSS
jgi:hypothetical protein